MPITRSAKKALRQSKRRAQHNMVYKNTIRSVRREFKKFIGAKNTKDARIKLSALYKVLDKAAKERVISKNKAARLKSRATKVFNKTAS